MLIGAIIVVVLAVVGVLAWVFWPKVTPPATGMVNNNAPVLNVNKAVKPGTSGGTVTPPIANVPILPYVPPAVLESLRSIPAGLNRPITPEERRKYDFSATDDIWVKTTSPTDGSVPQMSFFNKTINPSPKPYVETPPPPKKQ